MFCCIGLCLFSTVFILLFIYQYRKLNYWKRRGIAQATALPFFGNILEILFFRKSLGDVYKEIYDKSKDLKYVGLYHFMEPCLLVKDVGIIENILVKDFSSFVNRGVPRANEKSEIDFGLFQLQDTLWRGIRYKLTPAFSSGKLKLMFENMKPCSQNTLNYIESIPQNGIDFKEVTTRFTMDVIGSCAFGLDVSKDSDANSKFRVMGEKIISQNGVGYLYQLLFILLPKIAEKLGVMFTPGEVGDFFAGIIKDTLKVRQESKVKRNDLVDLLLQIKEQGTITVHNKDPDDQYLELENVAPSESFAITDPMLISQAFTFFSAGFDGLSTPSVCILYELAKQKHFQERAREEILSLINKYGSLTYDVLKNAKFLDGCLSEGLRLYPLVSFLLRETTKEYELENGIKIEAGTRVVLSTIGLQMDPQHYTDPKCFNPDRMSGKTTASITDFTNLPFGAGPRVCIGMRMAQLIMKLFLAVIISNYDLSLNERCPKEIKLKKASLVTTFEHPLYFNVKRIYNK